MLSLQISALALTIDAGFEARYSWWFPRWPNDLKTRVPRFFGTTGFYPDENPKSAAITPSFQYGPRFSAEAGRLLLDVNFLYGEFHIEKQRSFYSIAPQ
jgi:hypothetical protein